MTTNLKCPFCSAELVQAKSTVNKIWHCSNIDCKAHDYFGVDDFWNTVIDGKKAQDALRFISNIRGGGMSYQDMFLDAHAIAKYVLGQTSDFVLVGRYTQDQMEQITSITKQEN